MNFPPFGSPFSSPSIHQFASSSMNASSNIQVNNNLHDFWWQNSFNRKWCFQDVNNRYNSSSSNIMNIPHFNQSPAAQIPKFNASNAIGNKYGSSTPGMTSMTGDYSSNGTSIASSPSLNAMHSNADDKNVRNYQQNFNSNISPNQSQMPELTQDLCNALLNQQTDAKKVLQNMNSGWQSALAPTSAVADYLSHLPASTLPLSLHHFLKYSAENIKKEVSDFVSNLSLAESKIQSIFLFCFRIPNNRIIKTWVKVWIWIRSERVFSQTQEFLIIYHRHPQISRNKLKWHNRIFCRRRRQLQWIRMQMHPDQTQPTSLRMNSCRRIRRRTLSLQSKRRRKRRRKSRQRRKNHVQGQAKFVWKLHWTAALFIAVRSVKWLILNVACSSSILSGIILSESEWTTVESENLIAKRLSFFTDSFVIFAMRRWSERTIWHVTSNRTIQSGLSFALFVWKRSNGRNNCRCILSSIQARSVTFATNVEKVRLKAIN